MSYIEHRIAQQNAKQLAYAKKEERFPPLEKQILLDLTYMKNMNEKAIETGMLTAEKYANLVKLQLAKD